MFIDNVNSFILTIFSDMSSNSESGKLKRSLRSSPGLFNKKLKKKTILLRFRFLIAKITIECMRINV